MSLVFIGLCSFGFWKSNEAPPVDKVLYQRYLDKFKEAKLPLVIDNKYIASGMKTRPELGNEFGSFIPSLARGYMSRMGPDDFSADAIIVKSKTFNAVLYVQSPSYGDNNSVVLSTIDKDGNVIAQETVAYSYDDKSYQSAVINADLSIDSKTYDDALTSTDKYQINADGSISKNGKSTGKMTEPAIDFLYNLDNNMDNF